MPRPRSRSLLALFLLTACAEKGVDSQAPDTGLCADAPVLMWANFGEGFLKANCQSCHASTSTNRSGAPEEVSFDTVADAVAHAERIAARATGEAPDMPPQGGVSDTDREKLNIWLSCYIDDETP